MAKAQALDHAGVEYMPWAQTSRIFELAIGSVWNTDVGLVAWTLKMRMEKLLYVELIPKTS
jgi:hypothetical protein